MRILLCLLLGLLAATGAAAAPPPSAPIAQRDLDRIGAVLLRIAPVSQGRLLFVAQLDRGYMESQVLWHRPGAAALEELEPSPALSFELLEAALAPWEAQARRRGQPRWDTIFFLVEDGRFSARVARRPAAGDGRVWENAEIARSFSPLPIVARTLPRPPPPPTRTPGETVPTDADLARIRTGLLAAAGRSDAKIVLFGRFDSEISAFAIRYRLDGEAEVRAGVIPTELDPGLVEIWNAARARMGREVWHEMIVIVDHGVARITLRQPVNPDFHAGFDRTATEVEQAEFPPRH